MKRTQINFIQGTWKNVKNKCRTTVGKQYTDAEPNGDFKRKLLISEHTPIRLLEVDWSWKNIKYWVSTEWSRHKFEKFISTQRTDRTGIERDGRPQSALVNYDGYANAQQLIDVWRKRLCFQATKEARQLAEDFKEQLHKVEPELADALVPNCIYRCGCPEFGSCGFFEVFVEKNPTMILSSIEDRYQAYNEEFY